MHLRLTSLALAVASPVLTTAMSAQQPHNPLLLVLAKKDEKLALVDPSTLAVIAKISSGGNPHEVLASPDGRAAWISNYGNGSLHSITVIDLASRSVERTIDLGPLWGPHGLAFAQGHIYVTAEREKLVFRLSSDSQAQPPVDWLLGTGQTGTHMLWISPDASEIITVNVGSGSMNLFHRRPVGPLQAAGGPPSKAGATTTHGSDPAPVPDWDQTIVKVGGLPEGFDVLPSADGHAQTIWVANAKEGTISVIDVPSHTITSTIDAAVPTANRLRFTLDHRLALVSREKSGELAVLDVASRTVLKRINLGTGAAGILIAPDGRHAYISCSPDNKVVVLDLQTLSPVGTIQPGNEPDGLAWAPSTTRP